MSDANPYVSPVNSEEVGLATAADVEQWRQGLYRKGNQLVMHKNAFLPDRCVKTNKPVSGERLCCHFVWIHPLLLFTLPLGVVPFLILFFLLRKEARIYISLSEQWSRKRRRAILIGRWITVLGAAIVGASIMTLIHADVVGAHNEPAWAQWGVAIGTAVFLGGILYGAFALQIVWPTRINNDYIWLKGVHPDYLAELPPWPNRP